MFQRFSNWATKYMPTREEMEGNKYLRPIAHRFLQSDLWRLNRRSVPRGFALGLFAGIVIPFGQIFLAAFLARPFRANVPIAAAATFLTNPITTPFVLFAGNRIGSFALRLDSVTHGAPITTSLNSSLGDWLYWLTEQAGITAFGLVLLSFIAAFFGYFMAQWGWNYWVAHKWKKRVRRRISEKRAH